MPSVRRHRIGDQLPAVIHPDPDQDAIALAGTWRPRPTRRPSSSSAPGPPAAGTSGPIST